MKRLALLFAGAAVWLLLAAPVFADNGPHRCGRFGHDRQLLRLPPRTHRPRGESTRQPSQTSLCYTCHGTSGTGATTNVQDGQQYVPASLAKVTTVTRGTTVEGGLRGGGFDHAVINTAPTTIGTGVGVLGTPATTTSAHAVSGTGTAWGNGALGTAGAGPTISDDVRLLP